MNTYVFHFELLEPAFPVTRTLKIPADYPADAFPDLVDIAMGWEGLRLVTFRHPTTHRAYDYPIDWPTLLALAGEGLSLYYRDTGYEVVVTYREATAEELTAPVLTAAAGLAPPEYLDDPGSFPALLEALRRPDHPTHDHARYVLGPHFPETVPVAEINRELAEPDDEMDHVVLDLLLGNQTSSPESGYQEEERELDREWLEKNHGICLSDDNVYDVPEPFRALEEQVMLANPRLDDLTNLIERAERVYEEHPELPSAGLLLAGLYTATGKPLKARRLQDELARLGPTDDLGYSTLLYQALPPEELADRLADRPEVLDVTSYPAGRRGCYPTELFFALEVTAVRYFLAVGRYPVALARYDRLARTGFPLGDLEEAGDPIALYQLEHPDVLEDRSLCQLDTRGEQLLEELREEHELAL